MERTVVWISENTKAVVEFKESYDHHAIKEKYKNYSEERAKKTKIKGRMLVHNITFYQTKYKKEALVLSAYQFDQINKAIAPVLKEPVSMTLMDYWYDA